MSRSTKNRMVTNTSGGNKETVFPTDVAHESENARMGRVGVFKQHNVAISQTGVALPAGLGTGDLTFVTAPRAGQIVGIAWGLSTAATHVAGSLKATVGGTASGDAVAIDGGGTTGVTDETTPIWFAEGDKLGIKITTDANFLPNGSADLAAELIVRWAP